MAFLDWVLHPTELWAAFWYVMRHAPADEKTVKLQVSGDMKRCYDFLELTSRSFAAVIQELHPKLRDGICLFYLVLRGLDTIEDDMTIPLKKKQALLEGFHRVIYQKGWKFEDSGPEEKDAQLLVEFEVIINEFLRLPDNYQEVIADITRQMGMGMSKFTQTKVATLEDYDEYCHYVAGLVGHGLSRLFAQSELEAPEVGQKLELANSMGLFLQKTNITRDINEDVLDGRLFWPKAIWGKYAETEEELIKKDTKALNEMCLNALGHIGDVLEYLEQIHEPSVFRFCAIPQVMAIATLGLCFDNQRVLGENVKIRKGEALKLIGSCQDIESVRGVFYRYLEELEWKTQGEVYLGKEVGEIAKRTKQRIAGKMKNGPPVDLSREWFAVVVFIISLAAFFQFYSQVK